MNFKPLGNRVLVLEEKPDEVSAGGIYIPPTAQKQNNAAAQATVIEVGPGKDGEPVGVKAQDKVLVEAWKGNKIKLDGEEYLIVEEDCILGVVEEA